jgi:hypothetical protein
MEKVHCNSGVVDVISDIAMLLLSSASVISMFVIYSFSFAAIFTISTGLLLLYGTRLVYNYKKWDKSSKIYYGISAFQWLFRKKPIAISSNCYAANKDMDKVITKVAERVKTKISLHEAPANVAMQLWKIILYTPAFIAAFTAFSASMTVVFSVSVVLTLIYVGMFIYYTYEWYRCATLEKNQCKEKLLCSVSLPLKNKTQPFKKCGTVTVDGFVHKIATKVKTDSGPTNFLTYLCLLLLYMPGAVFTFVTWSISASFTAIISVGIFLLYAGLAIYYIYVWDKSSGECGDGKTPLEWFKSLFRSNNVSPEA